jgi:pimeloyl-ACP methyl ester carboxylesterase
VNGTVQNRTVLGFAKDVRELLDHLKVHHFSLMGFSSGAPYVHACVYEFGPKRVLSATTIGGQGPFWLYQSEKKQAKAHAHAQKGAGQKEHTTLDGFRRGGYRGLLFFNYAMSNKMLRPIARLYYAQMRWRFLRSKFCVSHRSHPSIGVSLFDAD